MTSTIIEGARIDAIDLRLHALEAEIRRVEERLDRRMDAMAASITALSSDLIKVALGQEERSTA
jgi:hypothetical protein